MCKYPLLLLQQLLPSIHFNAETWIDDFVRTLFGSGRLLDIHGAIILATTAVHPSAHTIALPSV